jgi:flagellar basal-body rod protein FlgF
MDRFVYIAAAAAKQVQYAQSVNAHNLANASTTGFKQDMVDAETVYLVGEGSQSRAYNVIRDVPTDLRQGMLEQTGRQYDIAINGDGWFAAQGENGTEVLTRRGDLRIDELGQVRNGDGLALMGNAGPIALPPASSVSIASDGTISIVPLGEAPNAIAVLDRIKMVNPPIESLRKTPEGHLQSGDGLPLPPDGTVRLATGSLEASNVNAITAMVNMIELSRQFEHHMKMVAMGEELDNSSSSLMRMQS